MYRTNTCGELRISDAGKEVTLSGWVQRSRKMGGMTFLDLRDRYGITQLVFNEADDAALCGEANKLGREYCIQVKGTVSERQSKNSKIPTGDIEIIAKELKVLSPSLTPPFTIEDNTDGGDDLREIGSRRNRRECRDGEIRRPHKDDTHLRHPFSSSLRRLIAMSIKSLPSRWSHSC